MSFSCLSASTSTKFHETYPLPTPLRYSSFPVHATAGISICLITMASRLPEPRRVIASNLPSSSLGFAEPPVGITIDKLTPISIFGGQFEKVIVGIEGTVPADNSAP